MKYERKTSFPPPESPERDSGASLKNPPHWRQKKVVIPLAINVLKKEGIKNPRQKIHLLTYKELQGKQFTKLEKRMLERKEEKLFIYENINGVEKVKFSHENQKILAKLTGISLNNTSVIKGVVAYQGKVTGLARIVLNNKAK